MYRFCVAHIYLSTSTLRKVVLVLPGSPFFTEKTRKVLAFTEKARSF